MDFYSGRFRKESGLLFLQVHYNTYGTYVYVEICFAVTFSSTTFGVALSRYMLVATKLIHLFTTLVRVGEIIQLFFSNYTRHFEE